MQVTQDATFSDIATGCDREPIHRPERIQSHGLLLLVDRDGRITRVSANARAFLKIDPATVLQSTLRDVVGDATSRQIAAAQKVPNLPNESRFACTTRLPGVDGPVSV